MNASITIFLLCKGGLLMPSPHSKYSTLGPIRSLRVLALVLGSILHYLYNLNANFLLSYPTTL